jgi:hypothetical protein
MTINANVTSMTFSNPTAGQHFTIKWIMGAGAPYSVVYPATVFGWSNVDNTASAVTVQTFVCISSTEFRAEGPGSTNST